MTGFIERGQLRTGHERHHTLLFTDIDGTLVEHDTYEPGPALRAIPRLQAAGIAIIPCSAKTRAEQEAFRTLLRLSDPFIVENGAGVVFPEDFPGSPAGEGEQELVTFGLTYREVREGLETAAKAAGVEVRGYGDMSVEEVAALTRLNLASAARARTREFTETFVILEPSPEAEAALAQRLEDLGMGILRGARYWTALGRHDKGQAVRYVISRYAETGSVVSYGVGDFHNDLGMLAAVDHPMLVQRPDGSWADLDLPGLRLLEGVGPAGWVRAADVAISGK